MLSFFVVGMTLGFLMRLELIAPGKQLVEAQTYNALFTLHGVIMIFLFVIPGLSASFGNFFLPLQIGAGDVAFPRLNLLSWWIFIIGAGLAVVAMFTGNGPPDTGWTFYAPYSLRSGTNVVLAVFAVFVLGFSSILTGLNFITTIHRLRAPGMSWFRMPLFVWGLYATAWTQVLATPVVGINLLLIIAERLFGIGVFDPAKGRRSDPLPASLLDLLAPRRLHHDSARDGGDLRDHACVRPADDLRVQVHRVFEHRHRLGGRAGVGPPHVRERRRATRRARSSRCSPCSSPYPAPSRSSTGWPRSTRARSSWRRRFSTRCPSSFSSPSAG